MPCAVRSQNATHGFSRSRSRIVAQRAAQRGRKSRARSEPRHLDSCREEHVMLQEGSRVTDDIGSTWDRDTSLDWRTVDRTLRGIARRRAALDLEEARWLYEAERLQIW